MSDPIKELRRFRTEVAPAKTLGPATVRRRGDRIRRRNAALITSSGIALAAAIATPFVVSGGAGTGADRQAPVASQSAQSPVTMIPAGIPLGAGMADDTNAPHVGSEPGEAVMATLAVCGHAAWEVEDPAVTDTLGATWSNGREGGRQRTLALYETDDQAAGAVARVREDVVGCVDPQRRDADEIRPIELVSRRGGALAYMEQYRSQGRATGDANVYVITVVGNALLIDKTYTNQGASIDAAQQTADDLGERATDLTQAMCIFDQQTCN